MSRLFVSNLPKNTTEKQLRDLFGQKGTVTDCSLKYTADGKFRRFAFVGFSAEEEAKSAQKYFDKTYMNTSRIKVDIAVDLGSSRPRPWGKLSKAQVAEQTETAKTEKERKAEGKKKKKEEKEAALLGELREDPEFKEYMAVYSASKRTAWDNDADVKKDETTGGDDKDSDDETEEEEEKKEKEEAAASDEESGKKQSDGVMDKGEEKGSKISDLDFLKSKMAESTLLSSDEDEENDDGNVSQAATSPSKEAAKKKEKKKEGRDSLEKKIEVEKVPRQRLCIKMKGLKANVKESVIREFFKPVKVKVHLPKNKKKLAIGIAFVECFSEKELEMALAKNKSFIGKKKVYLTRVFDNLPTEKAAVNPKPKPWEQKELEIEAEESIAESGRLFVRNLAYICTEEDLEALFSQYGPVTDLDLPVDPVTKRIKGFAFITFMFPEHAVKARMELDHKGFKGRLMHILPGKDREEKYVSSEKSSYKKLKDEKTKALAKSSHNWNTLFLSGDAVATAMAAKYQTDKSDILDDSGRGSLGVRMALGETQLVQETRQFLIDNGVALDSFSQADGERSKRVIIVKDLPAGTEAETLSEVFGKFGTVTRVVLPPHGITALVEFQETSEAKRAFSKLGYRRFKDRPLYLEWAPMAVFGKDAESKGEDTTAMEGEKEEGEEEEEGSMESGEEKEEEKAEGKKQTESRRQVRKEEKTVQENSDSEEESEPNSTLYVKNINFDTTEATLKELFSKAGNIRRVTIAKKKDMKNPGKFLSMGYGFVEYRKAESAKEALKTLQKHTVDGHQLELKISQREILQPTTRRKKQSSRQKGSTKILVRNIPFQSNRKEVTELFRVFGELKYVRVPKKASGPGIQGFAFVDFLTKEDAKRAFDALCHSTHLYGRRLVLEWASTVETVEELQSKTKRKFQGGGPAKKLRKQDLMGTLIKE
ncbi:putative RNA-binding protein 19 isoform X2 [Babylonia areolata]|uniref:putative RNA-binding protein 19 isoform X2 n=1 Tax=Babylonia areolata TaxID=304850 RepID=UPI003FD02258